MRSEQGAVLSCRNLKVSFPGEIHPIRGVDLDLYPGEILGLIGESGAGKTLLARVLYGLDKHIPGIQVQGSRDCPDRSAMIFQDPGQYLNPGISLLAHFDEFLPRSSYSRPKDRETRIASLFSFVGLPSDLDFAKRRAWELSGGQQQRAMVALALAQEPQVLYADEALASLDGVNRARVADLLRKLADELGLGMLFITHDLVLADQICDRVAVMYAGRVVEFGKSEEVFCSPKHPYTRALLRAQPGRDTRGRRLAEIPGSMPGPSWDGGGCSYRDRCSFARELCAERVPRLVGTSAPAGHCAACFGVEQGWFA